MELVVLAVVALAVIAVLAVKAAELHGDILVEREFDKLHDRIEVLKEEVEDLL